MSTKISLFYKDDLHLYREALDEDTVYLKFRKEGVKVTLDITMKDFARVAGTFDIGSLERQASVTDEEIRDYCGREVDRRMASDGLPRFGGGGVYGSHDSPRETQIKQGVDFYTARRNKLRAMLEDIKNSRSSKCTFGLESLVNISYEE